MDFAHMSACGRLVDDPSLETSSRGNSFCKFTIAVNQRIPGAKDNSEKTSYIPVTVFGKDAVNCGKFLTKGREVLVSGNFEADKYTDSNGVKRTGFGIVARSVDFGYGGKKASDNQDDYDTRNNRNYRDQEPGRRGSRFGYKR